MKTADEDRIDLADLQRRLLEAELVVYRGKHPEEFEQLHAHVKQLTNEVSAARTRFEHAAENLRSALQTDRTASPAVWRDAMALLERMQRLRK